MPFDRKGMPHCFTFSELIQITGRNSVTVQNANAQLQIEDGGGTLSVTAFIPLQYPTISRDISARHAAYPQNRCTTCYALKFTRAWNTNM